MRALALGAVIVLLLLLLLWQHESDHIGYWLNCKFKNGVNQSGVPTPAAIRTRVRSLIDGLPDAALPPPDGLPDAELPPPDAAMPPKYTFVDLGCGDGDVIADLLSSDRLDALVGVELDAEQAARTRARFAAEPRARILAQNMTSFEFPDAPLVVYMYEPLWCLPLEDARRTYGQVLKNLTETTGRMPTYLIYVSGVRPVLDEAFFAQNGVGQPLHMSRARRGLGWPGNRVWMFRLDHGAEI